MYVIWFESWWGCMFFTLIVWYHFEDISHSTVYYVDPPVGWGSTYCFTAVGVGVGVLVGIVGVGVTSITKAPPAQIFFGWHVFCSPGHWLLISAMTLTFGVKVKL